MGDPSVFFWGQTASLLLTNPRVGHTRLGVSHFLHQVSPWWSLRKLARKRFSRVAVPPCVGL